MRWWIHERLYDLGHAITRLALRLDPRKYDFSYLAEEDEMCPNCVTPWKCNGPHLLGPSVSQKEGPK